MENTFDVFDVEKAIKHLRHYLPAQPPLKDFIHHNTLHAFQENYFHEAMLKASQTFGYQVYLSLSEYRNLYQLGVIKEDILSEKIRNKKEDLNFKEWKHKLLLEDYDTTLSQKIGGVRKYWKSKHHINLDKEIHPVLLRIVSAFLDQGISIRHFPLHHLDFFTAFKELNQSSYVKYIKGKRANQLLNSPFEGLMHRLLEILVGDSQFFEHYLFDQQFAHPGWSGMVSVLEFSPESILDKRSITLEQFIVIELLLELDALDLRLGEKWKPISNAIDEKIPPLFEDVKYNELYEVYSIWQEAYEWTYYDKVIKGLQTKTKPDENTASFQAVFCIDDRSSSIRRHIEKQDNFCKTYATAGFFNVPFYFLPEQGQFPTKLCPVNQFPKIIIKENQSKKRHVKKFHFNKHTHGFLGGMLYAPTMGIWSAFKLAKSILYPSKTEALISSFSHMDKMGKLSIEANHETSMEFQEGFTINEMADRIEGLLKGIGLVKDFAPIIYFIGHGASSVNNTHYAGYDCGACSGRAGSVNARVAAFMANNAEVRVLLKQRGIDIPSSTQFLGGLHDTTRDEIEFYDEEILSDGNSIIHISNSISFVHALQNNAKERSRKFILVNSDKEAKKVHKKVKLRSLSLFEPRPEWNHATNCLCIIGKRENNKKLFLDRRSFLNSYDYSIDNDGAILLGILNAVAPVCGGINLEYYFSRIDNYRLGAGSKLPHNVMGLLGVANGMDGDLRTGLPKQMIDIHDPMRLLVTVENYPDEVLRIIKINPSTYEWFKNEWIHLLVIHPVNKDAFVLKAEKFIPYTPHTKEIEVVKDVSKIFEKDKENSPVYLLN